MVKQRLSDKIAEGAIAFGFSVFVVVVQFSYCLYAAYDDRRTKNRIIREATPEQAKFLRRLRRSRTERDVQINLIHCRRAGVKEENILRIIEPHPLEQYFQLHEEG